MSDLGHNPLSSVPIAGAEESVASGAIAGAATITFSPAGVLTGAGALAGASTITFSPAGTLAGGGALAGASTITFSPVGVLAGSGALVGASTITFTPAGNLAGAGALSGAAVVSFTLAGATLGQGALAGTATVSFAASGALTGEVALAGAATLTFTAEGTITDSTPPVDIPVVTGGAPPWLRRGGYKRKKTKREMVEDVAFAVAAEAPELQQPELGAVARQIVAARPQRFQTMDRGALEAIRQQLAALQQHADRVAAEREDEEDVEILLLAA